MTAFTLDAVRATADAIAPYIRRTPLFPWAGDRMAAHFGDMNIRLKAELFQVSGTFKARGVVSVIHRLPAAARAKGVTGFSAGNHAVAIAYGAKAFQIPAKVVMIDTANEARRQRAAEYGAELVFAPDGAAARARAEAIVAQEGMNFVHPFEGIGTVLGTGTLGLEIMADAPDLDAIAVGVGGGGLAGGMAAAAKLVKPGVEIYGVEPEGSPVMTKSLTAGEPVTLTTMNTIADSLSPPFTAPGTFALCRDNLTDIVTVSDQELVAAMRLLFDDLKLVVEPGGAAAIAALMGSLKARLQGKKVAAILCGSNIDLATFMRLTKE